MRLLSRFTLACVVAMLAARGVVAQPQFPSTAAPLAALWTSDSAVNTGDDTDITQINDLSGNGHALAVAPGYAAARFREADLFGPRRMVFSGRPDFAAPQGMPNYFSAEAASISNYSVTLSPPLSGSQPWAFVFWCRPRVVAATDLGGSVKPLWLFHSETSGAHRIGYMNGRLIYVDPGQLLTFATGAGLAREPVITSQEPGCVIVQRNADRLETFQGGRVMVNQGLSPNSGNSATFNIGAQSFPSFQNFFSGDLYGAAIFRGSLSAAEREALAEYGRQKWGIQPNINGCTVFVGDSITFGYGVNQHQSYPAVSRAARRYGAYANLGAIGAFTTGLGLSTLRITHPSQIALRNRFSPGALGVPQSALILCIGTNDCVTNQTRQVPDATNDDTFTTTVAQAIANYCIEARNAGFSPIYVCTPMDATSTQFVDNFNLVSAARARARYDMLIPKIISRAAQAQYQVIPLHLNPIIGVAGASNDTFYWRSDRTHPTTAGLAELARAVDAVAGEPVGACCLGPSSGDVCLLLERAQCEALAGAVFRGPHTSCETACPPAPGACCLPAGECIRVQRQACIDAGGHFLGNGSICESGVTCLTGACCFLDGSCAVLTSFACSAQGGNFAGIGVTCAAAACPEPTGACCRPDGVCSIFTPTQCAAASGTYLGHGTACVLDLCVQPHGACCFEDGSCAIMEPIACSVAGGNFAGIDVTCEAAACPQPFGACCFPDGSCDLLGITACITLGGAFSGNNTTCHACGTICDADFNGDGDINPDDLGDFLNCYFSVPACERGDYNGDGDINPDDLGDYINSYFACA